MNTLTIQVSDSQKKFLENQAAQEGLASPSDYVRELIRDAEKRKAWAKLEQEIQLGLDSGEPMPMTESHWKQKKAAFVRRHPKAGLP